MGEPKWTELRHRMLREVLDGKLEYRTGFRQTPGRVVRVGEVPLRSAEHTAVKWLDAQGLITRHSMDWGQRSTPEVLTSLGEKTLAVWDAAHPETKRCERKARE